MVSLTAKLLVLFSFSHALFFTAMGFWNFLKIFIVIKNNVGIDSLFVFDKEGKQRYESLRNARDYQALYKKCSVWLICMILSWFLSFVGLVLAFQLQ